ncbi:MgtC/SapB family protein [Uliginosibacterium paludis]|uniref:MgtC/SapB family protein n=1 Tax=Uliginosibacterium paludis TaxID=1615952 RepID=A0ABV2CQK0_9RHOO
MLMQIPESDTVRLFATALAIGALLGLERERRRFAEGEAPFAGIRSFILIAETGALAMWLGQKAGTSLIFIAALAGVCMLIAAAHLPERERLPETHAARGVTTELAAITTFLLGGMVMAGQEVLAVGLAVANAALLALKAPLHGLIRKIGEDDLLAGLKLLVASFIVLPLLPDAPADPWQVLNPYKLWLLVVLISALSLVGYVAMRWLGGARGVAVTGFAGGLVSSTAVTLSLARDSKGVPEFADAHAAGILVAWTVMFFRVGGMLLVLSPSLLHATVWPLGLMCLAGVLPAIFFYRRSLKMPGKAASASVPLSNPFSLLSACRFAALFALVLLLVEFARRSFEDSGVVFVALLAGATDVDAITLSMVDFGKGAGLLSLAATAVAVGILSNTATKAAMCFVLGSRALALRVGATTLVMLMLGAGAVWLG